MRKTRALQVMATMALAAIVAAGCGGDDGGGDAVTAEGPELFVVSPYLSLQPATKELVDAFVADATAAGYRVGAPVDTANDFARLNTEMEGAVSRGVDAIVIGMGDPAQMTAGLTAATGAGIPVFGLSAGVAGGVTANITSDEPGLGQASAGAMADRVGEGGRVILVHFDPYDLLAQRATAARALFAERGVAVVEDVQGDLTNPTDVAKSTVTGLLATYGNGAVNGIWVAWDAAALGAFQATLEAGRTEVFVASVDGQDFARDEIRTGTNWIATVRPDWAGIAEKAVETIDRHFAGQPLSGQQIVVAGRLLTKDTA
jgi:ribose transport system substrate-binding protein